MLFLEGMFRAKLNSPDLEHTLYAQHMGVSTLQNYGEQPLRFFSKNLIYSGIYIENIIKIVSKSLEIERT